MKAVITLDQNAPAKVEIEKGGSCRTIYMNQHDLAEHIHDSFKNEWTIKEEAPPPVVVDLYSSVLPLNTVKYAKLSNDTELVFLVHPQTKANVKYHDSEFKNVPFPNLVFCFGVRNRSLVKKSVFAFKDRFLRDHTELFRFPYSNVFQGGSMCYYDGQEVQDLVQLQTFPSNWMRIGYNDHLYTEGANNKLKAPLREVFNTLQGQEFDYDILQPVGLNFKNWSESTLLN